MQLKKIAAHDKIVVVVPNKINLKKEIYDKLFKYDGKDFDSAD